uniref:Uncharacterized protein n=1 Tax=Anguilla anguilla TaxID=7936 RepID=A0A0E9UUC2_ANGAN
MMPPLMTPSVIRHSRPSPHLNRRSQKTFYFFL